MTGKTRTYLIRDIPADLWRDLKVVAARNGETMHALILRLLAREQTRAARKPEA